MAPLAETLSYSNSIVKINLGIANHKIPRYKGASDTNFEKTAKFFTGLNFWAQAMNLEVYSRVGLSASGSRNQNRKTNCTERRSNCNCTETEKRSRNHTDN